MCWESEIDTRSSRADRIAWLKADIKKLREEKNAIENKIKSAWKRMDKICGHPRVRISSWSRSTCVDCGYYDLTKYFWDLGSTIIDVDGSEKKK